MDVRNDHYDVYGSHHGAFDGYFTDKPEGQAEKDYIRWLYENPDIAKDIDDMIMNKIH